MASRAGVAASGAVGGAAAGSVLGPWGAAGGALLGGVGGWLSGGNDKSPEQIEAERQRALATQMAGSAASGQGPSAAQSLLNLNVSRSNDMAMSQAKGMAGANPALAAIMASNAAAQNSQAGIANAAALRAQEMNDARAQYIAATGGNVEHATQGSNANIGYNNSLYNSLMSGGVAAAGKIAGAGQPKPAQDDWATQRYGI